MKAARNATVEVRRAINVIWKGGLQRIPILTENHSMHTSAAGPKLKVILVH